MKAPNSESEFVRLTGYNPRGFYVDENEDSCALCDHSRDLSISEIAAQRPGVEMICAYFDPMRFGVTICGCCRHFSG